MLLLLTSLISLFVSMIMIYNNMFLNLKFFLINTMTINLSVDMLIDWMSILFLSTVSLISSMIIMFSIYYIPKSQHKLFMILLLMFVMSMMILIMSNNLFLILLGWDGLGLSSYILVVYYQDYMSNASGSITLLSNRLGDIMIIMSIAMLMMTSNWNFSMNMEYPSLTMILLMVAACSKSAQFPFSAWLPMAMAAPTPISALVHSSTLVTAGVFLFLRISNNHPFMLIILMIVSSITALYSSMSANWEQDMKKIIALSTLSQIAMMMFALSMNMLILSFLHLIIHALFKSTMFLCAGMMIHESSYQDMRMMTFNMNNPLILATMGITTMALMGIPFMSGFFSKDAIMENMISSKLKNLLSIFMITSIGMTASYSIRMIMMSNKFLQKSQPKSTNHLSMFSNIPLMIMSPLTIISGTTLSWLLNPEQLFLLSFLDKCNIFFILSMGILFGLMLSFKSKKFQSLGKSSLSMWAIHLLTTIPMLKSSFTMMIMSKNDKSWQEMYGPLNSFYISMNLSIKSEFIKTLLMMVSIMLMLIPLVMLM